MTVANNVFSAALANAGIVGVGQSPLASDLATASLLFDDMVNAWAIERQVKSIQPALAPFLDLTSDVPFWTPYEGALVWGLTVRLRAAYALPPDDVQIKLAQYHATLLQANNKQFQTAPQYATIDTSGNGLAFLALRAAGRITDEQGVNLGSQDQTDAVLLLVEMLDEWQQERSVTVTPGTFPVITDPGLLIAVTPGLRSAIVWNLAVRIRSAFGMEDNKVQAEQAARSLALVQANNKQFQPSPVATDTTAQGLIYLALRAAGRIDDDMGAAPTSQDVSDGYLLLNEMLAEWQLERTVTTTPGALPTVSTLTGALVLAPGYASAIFLNLAVRIREAFNAKEDGKLNDRAARALKFVQANNKQYQPAQGLAADDTTVGGVVFLALRAAGRIDDDMGAQASSQDVTDALSLWREMFAEWQQDRTVTVTPGTFPVIGAPAAGITLGAGLSSATVLNLAVRIKVAFGDEPPQLLRDMAGKALAAVQANNKQQVPSLLPGVPATALQIIFQAFRMAGRVSDTQGVSVASQDVDDAFNLLVTMLAQWSRERWLTFDLSDVACLSTGAETYSIGAGGDFNVARPDRIESAFVRLNPGSSEPIDYQLDIFESREDYNEIGLKYLSSFPSVLFYDSAYPLGTIYVSPVPVAGTFELHVSVKATLPVYANTSASLGLPPEYNEALYSNLACRIMAWNGGQPTPFMVALASKALRVIRGANAQVPRLGMPNGIPLGRSWWGMPGWAAPLSAPASGASGLGALLLDANGNQLLDASGNALSGASQ